MRATERGRHPLDRRRAVDAPDDQLGKERVVEAGYRVAFVDTGVLANPGTRCPSERRDRPRRREPPTEGVLGVDPALERGAAPLDVVLGAAEWLTARDPELLAHEVNARDQLRIASGERSEEHTSELQSHSDLVCRLLLEKKKNKHT